METMKRATGEERALARATIYRLAALAFSYPTRDTVAELRRTLDVAPVAAELIDPETVAATEGLGRDLATSDQPTLEAAYQRVFTLSYSEDCPIHETAFSAKHLFQQAQQQADIAGFYRAFGVDVHLERSDHLAVELEFCYLLALKEAHARDNHEPDHIQVCRRGQRTFLRDHLARWAPLIGNRVIVTGSGSWYERAGWLLMAFIATEERYLRLGSIERYRDDPILIADEPGDLTCPLLDMPIETLIEDPTAPGKEPERVVATPH
jgi:TorA maturation chaperone TorD